MKILNNNFQNNKQCSFKGPSEEKIFIDALKVADLKIALKEMKATRSSRPLDNYFAQVFEKLRLRFSPAITKSTEHEFTFNSNGDVITISKTVNDKFTRLAYDSSKADGAVSKRSKRIAYLSSSRGFASNIARYVMTLRRFKLGTKEIGGRTYVLETLNKNSNEFSTSPIGIKSKKYGTDVFL